MRVVPCWFPGVNPAIFAVLVGRFAQSCCLIPRPVFVCTLSQCVRSMGTSHSLAQSGMRLQSGVAERADVLQQFCARLTEPAFVSHQLESAPMAKKASGSSSASRASKDPLPCTGEGAVEYLITPEEYAEIEADVTLGRESVAAGLLPASANDARAQLLLARLFKAVSSSRLPGATFTGRLERRIALAHALLPVMQMLGPYGQPIGQSGADSSGYGGAGSDSSGESEYAYAPLAVSARPLTDFQRDAAPPADVLTRCKNIGVGSTAAAVSAAAADCVARLKTVPCLSLFRHWALKHGVQPAASQAGTIVMFDLAQARASSSLDTTHAPNFAVQTRRHWQSSEMPRESFWRCRVTGADRKAITRVSFRPHGNMRPNSVKVRASIDGTLYMDLVPTTAVGRSGDIVLDVPRASVTPVLYLEICLIGCQNTGTSGCVLQWVLCADCAPDVVPCVRIRLQLPLH